MTTAYDNGKVPEIVLRHRLLIARMESGLSQAALAQAIGISRQSVSNAESGAVTPRRIVINAWALATGVPVRWLLTGEAETPPPGPNGPGEGGNVRHQGLEPRTRWLSVPAGLAVAA